jgi:hypothetical protein
MKHFNLIHILLFLLLMLVYQCAGAQDYLLTHRGDSVTGEIKPLLYGRDKKVQVVSSDKEKSTYSLLQVKAYSLDGQVYHPVKGENGYVFMKLIKPGYLSLYGFQEENQTRFDGSYLLKRDGSGMVVPNLGFKKYIAKFLADCEGVSERIKSGALGKQEINTIVDEYNACIDGKTIDHNQVIVRQEKQSTKISAWDSLEQGVQKSEFSKKSDALEMITEIKRKIKQQETIPNFLVEGLRSALQETDLTDELDSALKEVEK